MNIGRGPPVAYAAIEAGDQWQFEITPLEDAIPYVDGVAIGFGYDVAIPGKYQGEAALPGGAPERFVQLVHLADGPLRVIAHTFGDRFELVSAESVFSGEVLVPTGTIAFEVRATGPWAISLGSVPSHFRQ